MEKRKTKGATGGEGRSSTASWEVIPSRGGKQEVAGRAPASCLPACVEKKTTGILQTGPSGLLGNYKEVLGD